MAQGAKGGVKLATVTGKQLARALVGAKSGMTIVARGGKYFLVQMHAKVKRLAGGSTPGMMEGIFFAVLGEVPEAIVTAYHQALKERRLTPQLENLLKEQGAVAEDLQTLRRELEQGPPLLEYKPTKPPTQRELFPEAEGVGPSRHPSNRVPLGNLGEALGRAHLEREGYTWLGSLKNNSNQGLDGVVVKDGKLYIVDVKTSTAANFDTSELQRMGPLKYAEMQIERALTGRPPQWRAVPPGTEEFARRLQQLLKEYAGKVEGLIVKVPNSGRDPSQIFVTPWRASE